MLKKQLGFFGVFSLAAKPDIPSSQGTRREFGDQNGSGFFQFFHYRSGIVQRLILMGSGAPGGFVALYRQQVFHAVGDAV